MAKTCSDSDLERDLTVPRLEFSAPLGIDRIGKNKPDVSLVEAFSHGVQITVYPLLAFAVFLLWDGWSRQTPKIKAVSQKQSMLIASPVG